LNRSHTATIDRSETQISRLSLNVTVATNLYEAFQSGDSEALLALLDPDVEWELVGPGEIPYFGRYTGIDEVRRFLELLAETCRVELFEVQSLIGTDHGALAEGRERARFAGHPRPYEMRWCHVLEIDRGRITRFTDHLDTAPMIEAWRS
jgi:ketosteroid isomerase-like protein